MCALATGRRHGEAPAGRKPESNNGTEVVMRTVVLASDLAKALRVACKVAPKRWGTLPVCTNVLLESDGSTLSVQATDLDVHTTGYVVSDGTLPPCIVSAHGLKEIVRGVKGRDAGITLSLAGETLTVEHGGRTWRLATFCKAEEFPPAPVTTSTEAISLTADGFQDALEYLAVAMSQDETRYTMNGIHVDGRNWVSTDTHRMHVVRADNWQGMELKAKPIIPAGAVRVILDALKAEKPTTVDLAMCGEYAVLTLWQVSRPLVSICTRLVDGQFPAWQQVIPRGNDRVAIVSTGLLTEALRDASVTASDRIKGVKLTVNGKIRVESSNVERGDFAREIPGTHEGGDITIGFNAKYLMEAIGPFEGSVVRMEMGGDMDPARILMNGGAGDYVAIVMPMRI